ncbi:MAG: hypothetical protein ABIQ27_10880 [Flavobacterium sp.]|uniref:hypothetical protein n=1 Tax=Flavobacterium sp. TaxID=239 RepID=UPI003263531D
MARKLTEAYVEDHMQYIEGSAQKVGQAVADLLLKSVKENIKKNGEAETIKFDGTFEVKAFEDVCVEVEICLPFVGCSKVHVGI